MKKFTFPLKPQAKSEAVADLQDGLLLLLDKGHFHLSDTERKAARDRLRAERTVTTYRETTGRLVRMFQQQHHLGASGEVDEPRRARSIAIFGRTLARSVLMSAGRSIPRGIQ